MWCRFNKEEENEIKEKIPTSLGWILFPIKVETLMVVTKQGREFPISRQEEGLDIYIMRTPNYNISFPERTYMVNRHGFYVYVDGMKDAKFIITIDKNLIKVDDIESGYIKETTEEIEFEFKTF